MTHRKWYFREQHWRNTCVVYKLQTRVKMRTPGPSNWAWLTVRFLHLPVDVSHRGSVGEHRQKHVECSWVRYNPWIHSYQQVWGSLASLVHHVIGGVAYCCRDDIFSIQLPRQDLGVLYDREQISRVLTERLVGGIEVLSTSSHGRVWELGGRGWSVSAVRICACMYCWWTIDGGKQWAYQNKFKPHSYQKWYVYHTISYQ